jgi:hypothetical protein
VNVGFTARQISDCAHLFDLQAVSDGLIIALTVLSDDRLNATRVISKRRLQKMNRPAVLKTVVFCLGIVAGAALMSV